VLLRARTDACNTLQYTTASSLLLQSVEELKQSSVELQHYAQRLERVEARCKKLEDTAATRAEVQRIAAEKKALYVGATVPAAAQRRPLRDAEETRSSPQTELNLSLLEAKKNIWGLEGDVQLLLADRARVVRIQ
jgi:hypothetical protein